MIGFGKIVGAFVLVSLAAATASAGLLGTTHSYVDADKPNGWEGTTAFQGDAGDSLLSGEVDWAVFGPGVFEQVFSTDDYTPIAGQFTYVYQVRCLGAADITRFGVGLENEASNAGFFFFADADPDITSVTPSSPGNVSEYDEVSWVFGTAIPQNGTSVGLVFSSPNTPIEFMGGVIDHGEYAFVEPVPSPSASPIPEPATIWLLVSALGMMFGTRWLRRR